MVVLSLPWVAHANLGPSPATPSFLFPWFCLAAAGVGGSLRQSDWRLARAIAAAWVVGAAISAILGLLQYFGASDAFSPWLSHAEAGQAFANLRQRNHFSSLMGIGLAALLWCVHRGGANWLSIPIVILLSTATVASTSRTGLLQLIGLMGITLWWTQHKHGLRWAANYGIVLTVVITYGVAAVVLPHLAGLEQHSTGILARLNQSDVDCSSRLTLWSNVLHLIAQKPWFGWGWGELDYAHFITLYPGDRFCDILDNAHNLPLHFAVELGVPFAATFCALCLWFVWRSKPWRETDATRQMVWSVLALIGLHSLLEYPLWYGPFQIAVGLCLFLLLRAPVATLANRDGHKPFRYPASIPIAWAAILIIAICTYAAWDYWRISQIYLPPPLRANAYRDNTLEKVQGTWLYKNQVRFAELTVTPMTPDNAAHLNALAKDLLHFSPEARVVQALIDSAVMLGRDDEALYYSQRFKAAFPAVHACESQ